MDFGITGVEVLFCYQTVSYLLMVKIIKIMTPTIIREFSGKICCNSLTRASKHTGVKASIYTEKDPHPDVQDKI
jgi:hypothetical protein